MKVIQLQQPRELPSYVMTEKTIEQFGYDPSRMSNNSGKLVIARCVNCNKERTLEFRKIFIRARCGSCSQKEFYKTHGGKRLGVKISEGTRKKISGQNHHFYGRTGINAIRYGSGGPSHPMYGKAPPHGKRIWYTKKNGSKICLRSTWEAQVAGFLDDIGEHWTYEGSTFPIEYEINGEKRQGTYTPDFYLTECDFYVEVKGFWRGNGLSKYKAFCEQYPNIKIRVWGKEVIEFIKKPGSLT